MKKSFLLSLFAMTMISSCQVQSPMSETAPNTSTTSSLVTQSTAPSAETVARLEFEERQDYDCTAAASLVNTGTSAVDALQQCIDNAVVGSKILLPGGKYVIDRYLVVRKSISLGTKGISATDVACAENDSSRCVTFMLSAPINSSLQAGMIQIQASKVEFDHIVSDGDRSNPVRQIQSLCRNDKTRSQAYNYVVDGPDFKMINSVIRNAPCGTGMEVRPTAVRLLFVNNFVGPNGIHNQDLMWADGVTIHDNVGAIVESNTFFNNTDVDLIFGGCQSCSISKNKIIHDSSFEGSTFAGLMLHSWDGLHGNYSGSVTQFNTVECSSSKRCGFGILLGSRPWYNQPYFGGIVADNTVNNAMAGLVVDAATGPITLENNRVTNSGGKYFSSCDQKEFSSFSISKSSVQFVKTNQAATINDGYSGCIANWWSKDSGPSLPQSAPVCANSPHFGSKNGKCIPSCGVLGGTIGLAEKCASKGLQDVGEAYDVPYCCKSSCDPKTQPSPHFGNKNGQCLPSCGSLGGTSAPSKSCASNGLRDVGTAYDVSYCCAAVCDPKTQPSPHYGNKNGQCLPSCGVLGGKLAPKTSCSSKGLRDAGTAYDVPYCCK